MLWGGREILLAQTQDCCLHNTKIAKFCCSPSANFSQPFCLYLPCHGNIWASKASWGKASVSHEIPLFCCASERSIYSFKRSGSVSATQSCHGALWELRLGAVCSHPLQPACCMPQQHSCSSHNWHWYSGCPYRASWGTLQRWGQMQINCCLTSKAMPWAQGCPFTTREWSKTFSTPNSYRAL